MAFGCETSNAQSETIDNTVNDAQQLDENGNILDYTTYGGETTKTTEIVIVGAEAANTATNAQTGTTVVTQDTITRSNTDYAKQTLVTKTAL